MNNQNCRPEDPLFIRAGNNLRGFTKFRQSALALLIGCSMHTTIASGAQVNELYQQTVPETQGYYRSSEQAVYSAQELAEDLSISQLPDPAAAFLGSSDTNNDIDFAPIDADHDEWIGGSAWITGIDMLLHNDNDRDEYFTGFSLSLDADTQYPSADVYAIIDIQPVGGIRERLHSTRDFTLYGNSISDEYRIEIDLVNNFPSDYYDLYVELRDAYDGRLLDRVDAYDFSNLSALPLEAEDLDYDALVHDLQPTPPNDDIRVVEYAGSSGLALLLSLVSVMGLRSDRSLS